MRHLFLPVMTVLLLTQVEIPDLVNLPSLLMNHATEVEITLHNNYLYLNVTVLYNVIRLSF